MSTHESALTALIRFRSSLLWSTALSSGSTTASRPALRSNFTTSSAARRSPSRLSPAAEGSAMPSARTREVASTGLGQVITPLPASAPTTFEATMQSTTAPPPAPDAASISRISAAAPMPFCSRTMVALGLAYALRRAATVALCCRFTATKITSRSARADLASEVKRWRHPFEKRSTRVPPSSQPTSLRPSFSTAAAKAEPVIDSL
mmetsp:Transcript_61735/g.145483  ORF Transcript_61735/g.145483 Transcript_61735/m.145483 type:complete len:206 (-) Transcript_61735:388-1005(-)